MLWSNPDCMINSARKQECKIRGKEIGKYYFFTDSCLYNMITFSDMCSWQCNNGFLSGSKDGNDADSNWSNLMWIQNDFPRQHFDTQTSVWACWKACVASFHLTRASPRRDRDDAIGPRGTGCEFGCRLRPIRPTGLRQLIFAESYLVCHAQSSLLILFDRLPLMPHIKHRINGESRTSVPHDPAWSSPLNSIFHLWWSCVRSGCGFIGPAELDTPTFPGLICVLLVSWTLL